MLPSAVTMNMNMIRDPAVAGRNNEMLEPDAHARVLSAANKGLHPGAIFVGDRCNNVPLFQNASIAGGGGSSSSNDNTARSPAVVPQQQAFPIFTKTDKKRAMVNAKFFSECCMSGVPSSAASDAANQAQEKYERWWIRTQADEDGDSVRSGKRRRTEMAALSEEYNMPQWQAIRELPESIEKAKQALLAELARSGGDTTTPVFHEFVDILQRWYASADSDVRRIADTFDGSWKSLNKPSFSECLGRNDDGDYKYTLGRIAFDTFRPTGVVCSIKGVYNLIRPLQTSDTDSSNRPQSTPSRLLPESKSKNLRIYEYVTLTVLLDVDLQFGASYLISNLHYLTFGFSCSIVSLVQIEANQTRHGLPPGDSDYNIQQPIHAVMTNHGYLLPDPEISHRFTVWFSGGSLKPNDERDLEQWRKLFDPQLAPPYRLKELANTFASRIFLGTSTTAMQSDGSLQYSFKRPIGGHGQVFIDVLYNDDNFRVVRGHHGSYFCFCRS